MSGIGGEPSQRSAGNFEMADVLKIFDFIFEIFKFSILKKFFELKIFTKIFFSCYARVKFVLIYINTNEAGKTISAIKKMI